MNSYNSWASTGLRKPPASPMGSGQMVRQLALDEKIAGSTPASPAIRPAQFESAASAPGVAGGSAGAGLGCAGVVGGGVATGPSAVPAGRSPVATGLPVAAAAASAAFLAWAA